MVGWRDIVVDARVTAAIAMLITWRLKIQNS